MRANMLEVNRKYVRYRRASPLGNIMNIKRTRLIKLRLLSIILLSGGILTAPGCTICCQPYLEDYVAFGSSTPRVDMKNGRVGSPFSDPHLQGTLTHPEGQNESGIVLGSDAELYYESELPAQGNLDKSMDPTL